MSSTLTPERAESTPPHSAVPGVPPARPLSLRASRLRWPLRSVYQPLIDLQSGRVAGVEALTRARTDTGGASSVLEMFGAARSAGCLVELDWLCQRTAIESWIALAADPQIALFINVEPETVGRRLPSWMTRCLDALQASGIPVVIELTERGLDVNPRGLLEFRDRVRDRGWKLAIDDIGTSPESLSMIPIMQPDVLKLDMQLLHGAPTATTARVVNAVLAHASRTGARVVAEGIETLEHLELAISSGADLGQGWLFGRPSLAVPVETERMMPTRPAPVPSTRSPRAATTPWELIAGHHEVRRARKPLLAAMSRHIELQVDQCDGAAVVVSSFQHARNFTPRMIRRYQRFSSLATFVGVLAQDIEERPAPGVRGSAVAATDALAHEWTVVVISPFFSAAVIAKDTGLPAVGDNDRQFDYLVTYDRDVVAQAGQLLMRRFG